MFTTAGENPIYLTKYGDPLPLSPSQWLAVEKLLALDWHRRLWIYQEIMLSNQETTIIQLCNEEMLWKRFKYAVAVICVSRPPLPTAFLNPINHSINIETFAGKAIPSGSGLDYTKSAKEIFTSLYISHLAHQEEIQFLHFCNVDTNPSWAADPAETDLYSYDITCHVSGQSAAAAYLIEPGVLDDPIDLPPKTVLQPYADYSRDVISTFQKLAMGDLIHDDGCLDHLILILIYGGVRNHNMEKLLPLTDGSLSTLEEWRQKVRQFMGCSTETGCSVTRGGSYVRVTPRSRSGVRIAVLLGLSSAIALRPQAEPGAYVVIAPCYHPAYDEGQALLGDDFQGWERLWSSGYVQTVFWKEGEPKRRRDPRLDHVPFDEGLPSDIYSAFLFSK
ncbi:uncharacterized protein B0J16DRAFT_357183 [Fusarium flagelliforme]|uniref:uncharacterized protein n=1 Tax=Fusarium flagelliforme TaxID=2675880 RepID=UPI001E8DD3EF|nr:uncharacterized protein B0J16DRAFT_357183 [Fusarium flagelliforme]KAH7178974.1 hypothetical protein B0J16DRAFT_357183 [Fusarium flagelliforme]